MLFLAAVTVGSSTISSFLAELLLISAVALGCKYLRLPYTIALVAAGLLVGLLRGYFELKVQLTPDLLFVVLLPALLFEAAIHLPLQLVLAQLRPILLLAVPGLLITAALVGWGLHLWKVQEQIDDPLIEMTLSTILAYGSYLLAQQMHASGVMAVIAAGLIYGNFAMGKSMSANTRLALGSAWDYLGFCVTRWSSC